MTNEHVDVVVVLFEALRARTAAVVTDEKPFRKAPIDDGVMQFTTRRVRARAGSATD